MHGIGGQPRAFIHLQDTVRCVALTVAHPPPDRGPVRIFNQMTETHRVADLAKLVARLTGAEVGHLPNPRNEAAEGAEATPDTAAVAGQEGAGEEQAEPKPKPKRRRRRKPATAGGDSPPSEEAA